MSRLLPLLSSVLLLLSSSAALGMQIYVQPPSGKPLSIEAEAADRISLLKRRIEDRTGVPRGQQRLLYGDQLLDDDLTVVDYRIRDRDTLLLGWLRPDPADLADPADAGQKAAEDQAPAPGAAQDAAVPRKRPSASVPQEQSTRAFGGCESTGAPPAPPARRGRGMLTVILALCVLRLVSARRRWV